MLDRVTGLKLADIEATRDLIAPHVLTTPLHWWKGMEIDGRVGPGTQVAIKLELFQYTGTFKARGAMSNILRLTPDQLARGVTAVSAGNHAVAVAFAAWKLGVSAKVVMMSTASPARVARAEAYGAEVIKAGDGKACFELARRIEAEEGRAFIHPFEGIDTALGTATLGMEWSEQAGPLDAVILPVGGGGLAAGVASAFKLLQPECEVFGVEPEGADTMHRSFAAGEPQSRSDVATIADSLAPPYALPLSYGLCRAAIDELVMVDDDQLRDAQGVLFREMKLAVEPAGAATTAALFGPLRERLRGKRVGIIACGANIDIDTFCAQVKQGQEKSGRM
jgi:threonine dehydratase